MRKRVLAISLGALAVLICGGWLYATGNAPDRDAPEWLTDGPIAHRGLHDTPDRPENTLAAFEAAVDAGIGMELDVHLSSDGKVVVVHDAELERMTGDPRTVGEVSSAELAQMRVDGTDEHVPTLAEVLELVDGQTPILVEIKNHDDVGPLEDAVAEELAGYDGDVAVMSFNPYILQHMAEVAPDVYRGQLTGTFAGEDLPGWQKFALSNLLMNWASAPDFVAAELEMLPSAGGSLQKLRGRPLLAWTAESAEDYERAIGIADNVICDPDGLP